MSGGVALRSGVSVSQRFSFVTSAVLPRAARHPPAIGTGPAREKAPPETLSPIHTGRACRRSGALTGRPSSPARSMRRRRGRVRIARRDGLVAAHLVPPRMNRRFGGSSANVETGRGGTTLDGRRPSAPRGSPSRRSTPSGVRRGSERTRVTAPGTGKGTAAATGATASSIPSRARHHPTNPPRRLKPPAATGEDRATGAATGAKGTAAKETGVDGATTTTRAAAAAAEEEAGPPAAAPRRFSSSSPWRSRRRRRRARVGRTRTPRSSRPGARPSWGGRFDRR